MPVSYTHLNSQARERTQILMDVANQLGGLVIGTGDLSELALGWADVYKRQIPFRRICQLDRTQNAHCKQTVIIHHWGTIRICTQNI